MLCKHIEKRKQIQFIGESNEEKKLEWFDCRFRKWCGWRFANLWKGYRNSRSLFPSIDLWMVYFQTFFFSEKATGNFFIKMFGILKINLKTLQLKENKGMNEWLAVSGRWWLIPFSPKSTNILDEGRTRTKTREI